MEKNTKPLAAYPHASWHKKVRKFAATHKFWSAIAILAIVGGGWWAYSRFASPASAQTRYLLGSAQKGTIVASVSASGQISASNQLDIKPKASGEVIYVGVTPGQFVKAGTLIATLDATDAQKAVRDAEANLESAQISFEKLQKPPAALTLTQAQDALTNANDALTKLYADTNTDVVNTFLDVPDIITGLEDIQHGSEACGTYQWNLDCYYNAISSYENKALAFRDTAFNDYAAAKAAYDAAFADYQALGNSPDHAALENAMNDAYTAVQLAAKATKSTNAFVQLYEDTVKAHNFTLISAANAALANLNTYTGKLNTHLSALLSDANSLKQDKQNIVEKQQSLDQINAGADALDVRSSQLSLTKAQNALQDARNNLADYYVRAPFDGTIAAVNIKKYDTAGSGTAAATLITSQKIAELSLNEVDAAKIKVGNKATLTFDAIDGFTLTGQVAEMDTIGTVSQGVVSYSIKINFDSQDARIKPGMTVNASIITDTRQDVLTVPSSAVRTTGGTSYVQVFDPPISASDIAAAGVSGITPAAAPTMVEVQPGISDDTSTEIISGLTEGQQIVTRTIAGITNTTSSSAPSLFGGGGARTGGTGGAVRTSGGNATFISR